MAENLILRALVVQAMLIVVLLGASNNLKQRSFVCPSLGALVKCLDPLGASWAAHVVRRITAWLLRRGKVRSNKVAAQIPYAGLE